jgi:hypothetical protein
VQAALTTFGFTQPADMDIVYSFVSFCTDMMRPIVVPRHQSDQWAFVPSGFAAPARDIRALAVLYSRRDELLQTPACRAGSARNTGN